MKKIKFFAVALLAVASVLAVSCSSSNPNAPDPNSDLVVAAAIATSSTLGGGIAVVGLTSYSGGGYVTGATVKINGTSLTTYSSGGVTMYVESGYPSTVMSGLGVGTTVNLSIVSSKGNANASGVVPAAGAAAQTHAVNGARTGSLMSLQAID